LKKDELNRLEAQAKRIELKKKALTVYEHFLDGVTKYNDEFSEITDIISRHKTLKEE